MSVYTSRPILEHVAESIPSSTTYSHRWSAVVLEGMDIGRMSSFSAILS